MNSTKLARKLFNCKVGKDGTLDTTDWKQVRIQAAIAAMQGFVSNEIHLNHVDKVAEEKGINTTTFLAKCAIDCADVLVAELKKEEK